VTLVVQAEQDYLEQYNVDVILGAPFLMNYYTIFDLNTTAISIAFADAKYTQRSGMNLGSIVFVLILTILVLLSFLGCFLIFKQYKVAQ